MVVFFQTVLKNMSYILWGVMSKNLRQDDIRDCGLVVLKRIYEEFNDYDLDINELKLNTTYSKTGISIYEMTRLGKKYGLDIDSYEAKIEDIKPTTKQKLIAIIKKEGVFHYVQVELHNNKVYIFDPFDGEHTLSLVEFNKIFCNIICVVSKAKSIKTKSYIKNILWENFTIQAICIILLNVVLVCLSFVASFYIKIVVDHVIPNNATKELWFITIIFLIISLIRVLVMCIKSYCAKSLNIHIEFMLFNKLLWHLTQVANADLNKFTYEDILRRVGLISPISSYMSGFIFLLQHDILSMLIAGTFLMILSLKLFMISFASAIIVALISCLFYMILSPKYAKKTSLSMTFLNKHADLIKGIQLIKNENLNHQLFNEVSKSYKSNINNDNKIWLYSLLQKMSLTLIDFTMPLLTTLFATLVVFDNMLSLGTAFLFLSMNQLFIAPSSNIAELLLARPEAKRHQKLLFSLLSIKREEQGLLELNEPIKTISLQNFKLIADRPLLEFKHFVISKNMHFLGSNGAGKTTLLKTMSFLYHHESIYINELPAKNFLLSQRREKVKYISHDEFLPNISLWMYVCGNDEEKKKMFAQNISSGNLKNVLLKLKLPLNTDFLIVPEMLSAGQRQVISLLPLFATTYDVLLLDEAFENIEESIFRTLCDEIKVFQKKALVVEVSHSRKFLFPNSEEVNLEDFKIW